MVLQGGLFRNNAANESGGALAMLASGGLAVNLTVFDRNTAGGSGGAAMLGGLSGTITFSACNLTGAAAQSGL